MIIIFRSSLSSPLFYYQFPLEKFSRTSVGFILHPLRRIAICWKYLRMITCSFLLPVTIFLQLDIISLANLQFQLGNWKLFTSTAAPSSPGKLGIFPRKTKKKVSIPSTSKDYHYLPISSTPTRRKNKMNIEK